MLLHNLHFPHPCGPCAAKTDDCKPLILYKIENYIFLFSSSEKSWMTYSEVPENN